ncbi:MAG TPA: hypothetical protein VLH37_02500 [Bacteroidales bacterium]|nr:hypothetical protein [Bacteroidales bacterium]
MKIFYAISIVLFVSMVWTPGMAKATQIETLLLQEPIAQNPGIRPTHHQEQLFAQAATERPRRVAPARRARPDSNERIQPRQGARPEVVRPGGRPAGIGRPQGAARPQGAVRPRRR